MTETQTLYRPTDTDLAYAEWKANCGPAAMAAVIRKPVLDVRDCFPRFPSKPWVNPSHMMAALEIADVKFTKTGKNSCGQAYMPRYGLCFIQFDGPWSNNEAKILEAYRHTHWIGYTHDRGSPTMIYDVNGDGWISAFAWESKILPLFFKAHGAYSGTWWVRWACEVQS